MDEYVWVDVAPVLEKLTPHRRQVVERFLSRWPRRAMGKREILLKRGEVTVIRIGADYTTPHVIVKPQAGLGEVTLAQLRLLPGAKQLRVEGVSIPIDSLTVELVDEIVREARRLPA